MGTWICFTAKLELMELIFGAVAATIGVVGYLVFRRAVPIVFRPRVIDVLQAWRIPWYMIAGAVEIMHGLGRQLFSRAGAPSLVRTVAYDTPGPKDEAMSRQVLAVTYTTITPNFIVLGILSHKHQMLYHQILPTGVLQITRNLGAEP